VKALTAAEKNVIRRLLVFKTTAQVQNNPAIWLDENPIMVDQVVSPRENLAHGNNGTSLNKLCEGEIFDIRDLKSRGVLFVTMKTSL
jgi:hypothetical protein